MGNLYKRNNSLVIFWITISFAILFIVICALFLFLKIAPLHKVSIQILLLFCISILIFYIGSFCFVNGRSIPTQIVGDLISLSPLPYILHKSSLTRICFIFLSTLLLWIPLIFSAFSQKLTIFMVGYIIVWIMFFRAFDYAEKQVLEKGNGSLDENN